jgi:hypothetical protein
VRGARGTISVTSRVGEGATFRICLPAAEPEKAARAEARSPRRQQATILLVEDHEAVRNPAARALRGATHTVLVARDAERRSSWPMATPAPSTSW